MLSQSRAIVFSHSQGLQRTNLTADQNYSSDKKAHPDQVGKVNWLLREAKPPEVIDHDRRDHLPHHKKGYQRRRPELVRYKNRKSDEDRQ
jgi:hypothetical protein